MKRSQYIFLVLLIGGMSALNPVAIDSFLPAIPDIAKELAVDPGTIGITIGIYTLGNAFGQLFYGPLSDRFGRKPLLITGLTLYVLTGLAASFAPTIELLSLARFGQGMGAASGRILAMAIVRDKYDREAAARLLSYMMAVSGIMPIIGPAIGSVVIAHFGWPAVFIYMTLFALTILVISGFFLRETLPEKDMNAIKPFHLAMNFRTILRDPKFLAYTVCSSLSGAGLYAFLATVPDIIINTLDHGTGGFALLFAIVMACNMLAALVGGKLVMTLGIDRLMGTAMIFAGLSSLIFFGLAVAGVMTAAAIIIPFTLFKMSDSIIGPQATAGALSPFPKMAGAASSLTGSIRQLTGASTAILVGLFDDGTSLPMGVGILLAGMGPLIIYQVAIRPRHPTGAGRDGGGCSLSK